MMEGDLPRRKRRDNVEDQFGSPLYTTEPLPPYFTVADSLFFICFRSDPNLIQSILPPGLTADSKGTVMFAAFRCCRGWGLDYADMGLFLPVINEYPGPDTQESCFLSLTVGNAPSLKTSDGTMHRFLLEASKFVLRAKEFWSGCGTTSRETS